jgi:hypothetical protein
LFWLDRQLKEEVERGPCRSALFTPQSKISFFQANIERLKWLAEHKLLHPLIKASVKPAIEKNHFS